MRRNKKALGLYRGSNRLPCPILKKGAVLSILLYKLRLHK